MNALHFLRWLCKLFDKALVSALARGALAMCLQNTWANIVRKYSFLLQNIDVLNVHILSLFLGQCRLSDKSGKVMFQIKSCLQC